MILMPYYLGWTVGSMRLTTELYQDTEQMQLSAPLKEYIGK